MRRHLASLYLAALVVAGAACGPPSSERFDRSRRPTTETDAGPDPTDAGPADAGTADAGDGMPDAGPADGGLAHTCQHLLPKEPGEYDKCMLGMAIFTTTFTVQTGLGVITQESAMRGGVDFNDVSCINCHDGVGGSGDFDHRSFPDDSTVPHDNLRFHLLNGVLTERALDPDLPYMMPLPLAGLARFEKISDAEVKAGCGKDAALGIHGRPSLGEEGEAGFFGIKGNVRSLDLFNHFAAEREIGLCAEGVEDEYCAGPNFELTAEEMEGLAVFVRRGFEKLPTTPVQDARAMGLFRTVGCAVCHTPERNGTDLCLHEMGDHLRGHSDSTTSDREFLTQPLLVLRGRSSYLHIRPVATLREAVAAHGGGGEAQKVVDNFNALSTADQEYLLNWLLDGMPD